MVGDEPGPIGTPGEPTTVTHCWQWFGPELIEASSGYGVPVELLIACLCCESVSGAVIREDARLARREEPGFVSDVETPGKVSIGVAQTLLETARLALRHPHLSSDDLLEPRTSILACAAYMAQARERTRFSPPLVAAAYNAGGVYPDANRWNLRCYPLGTGRYIDSFVAWFNDAMQLADAAERADAAPSFARLMH